MTAGELLEILQDLTEEELYLPVGFAYNYGDYWHTIVVGRVTELDVENVKHSSYHNMEKLADEDCEDCEEWIVLQ